MKVRTSQFIIIFVLGIMMFGIKTNAQSISRSRIFTGGNLGLQFGTITFVDISPLVGYWFTDQLAGGIGATYMYYKDDRYSPSYKTDVYGGRVFGRYYPIDFLFGHAEYEILSYKAIAYNFPYTSERINSTNILVGGGYEQQLGEYSTFSIMVLWNLNDKPNSIYTNPIIRAGFNIGL